jgi:beta-hydroxyacyl-ACP dehydratase FabZ
MLPDKLPFESSDIQQILPHRHPFLLVDRILELEPGKRIVGIKNVTSTEFWVPGHFPERAIMPGVLILEALAQNGAVLVMLGTGDPQSKLLLFAGVEDGRFRRPVVPGDQLRLECDVLQARSSACKMRGKAYVDGKLVAEGVVLCSIVNRPGSEPPPPK